MGGKIFVPLSKEDWTKSTTVYVYNKDKEFGSWRGTSGFTVYAPEDGQLQAFKEGWILTGKNGGQREWVSTSTVQGLTAKFPTPVGVRAGEPLGKLDEDLRLAIGLTAAGDIGVPGKGPTWMDPVLFVQDPDVAAAFVDFQAAPTPEVGPGGAMVLAPQPGGAMVPAGAGVGIIQVSAGTAFWGGLILGGVVVLLVASAVK